MGGLTEHPHESTPPGYMLYPTHRRQQDTPIHRQDEEGEEKAVAEIEKENDQGVGVGEEEEDAGETVEKILAEQSSDSDWAEEEEDYAKVFVVKFEDGNALRKEDFLSGMFAVNAFHFAH